MEMPELSPELRKARKSNIVQITLGENKPVGTLSGRSKQVVETKAKIHWPAENAKENLTVKEALIRGSLVIIMPVLSAIDWSYGTHVMFFIAPIICYSEVTVFTMKCPVKALFSNYRNPPDCE